MPVYIQGVLKMPLAPTLVLIEASDFIVNKITIILSFYSIDVYLTENLNACLIVIISRSIS
jgi:hypothetical protein